MLPIAKMKSAVLALAAAALALGLATGEASARVKAGVLQCRIAPGVGMILVSSKRVSCDFQPTGHKRETYSGRISKLGVDIGFTRGGVIVWTVFAPHTGYSRYALAGHYGGASGEVSLVAGLGANVLVGGSNRSFALQPISVQGQLGVNFAVGLAALDLRAR